jgi:hypothetical protein
MLKDFLSINSLVLTVCRESIEEKQPVDIELALNGSFEMRRASAYENLLRRIDEKKCVSLTASERSKAGYLLSLKISSKNRVNLAKLAHKNVIYSLIK